MLSPHEFTVGYIGDAAGLSLVLPLGKYDSCFLVVAAAASKIAVCLDGDHRFTSFECTDNTSWKGLITPNVSIEIDETSLVDTAPLGTLVRAGSALAISAKSDGRIENQRVPLMEGLPPCRDDLVARFNRWRVVIGEGQERRELRAFEIT